MGARLCQIKQKTGQMAGRGSSWVAHRGFEPLISALRGRCPGPLDECAGEARVPQGSKHGQGRSKPAKRWGGRWLVLAPLLAAILASSCLGGDGSNRSATPSTGNDRPTVSAASPDPTNTPRVGATASPGATSSAAIPALPAALQRVLADVANVRQLTPPPTLRVATIAPNEVAAELERQFIPEDLRSFRDTTTLYRLLGHLRPDQDMKSIYLSFAGSGGVIGFYVATAKALWVVGDSSGSVDFDALSRQQKETLAHEFVHALQDFHFKLDEVYRAVVTDLDRSLASTAVIEGDAVVHQGLYAEKYLALPGVGGTRVLLASLPAAIADVPQSIIRELYFPYTTGAEWVRGVREKSGTGRINEMLANPPAGTAYVLHPELLEAGFKPSNVSLPDLTSALGGGWERQSGGTFGEFSLRNYLQLHIRALDAAAAAAGWAGDHYDVYVNGQESVASFRVHFKDAAEASQFANAQADFLEEAGAKVTSDGAMRLAQLPGGNVSATAAPMGADVVFVIGSNAEVARKAMAALLNG